MVTGIKNNETSSVMEPHSNLCQRLLCGSITLLASLLFTPVTSGQHPYMQLVSVLCKPVSSIPTSLSFFKSFYPFNQSTQRHCKPWKFALWLHYTASNYIHHSTVCILNIFIAVPCTFKYIHCSAVHI